MNRNWLKIAICGVGLQKIILTGLACPARIIFLARLASHRFSASFPGPRRQGGYIVILNVLIFVAISTSVAYALYVPLMASNRATGDLLHSKRAQMAAGSAAEETLYKMKRQFSVLPFETLTLADATADVSVATTFSGRTIQVSGEHEDVVRNLRIAVSESVGVSFHYGLQVGRGGFEMSGSSGVQGNVYSNGNILGDGSTYITGSATAASGVEPTLHVWNGSPGTPPHSVVFGGTLVWDDVKPNDLAQSFTVSTTTPVTSVRLYIKRQNMAGMSDATVRITNNTSNRPGNTTLASATLNSNLVTTSFNYLSLPLSNTPTLSPGTTYWLVIDADDGKWNNYFVVGANANGYAGGVAKTGTHNNNTWNDTNPAGLDIYFDLYVGGETSKIGGQTYASALTIGGNAWAHAVSGVTVAGTLHCQSVANANKPCDTSRPDPVQQPMPISDGNIEAWKAEAEAGGVTTGNISYGGSGQFSLGPQKIVGNLTVAGSAQLTVNGTLWVTGNVTVEGSGIIKLANSYGTNIGVIVTDGRVVGGGSGKFNGNGQNGSYMMVITTSACPISGSCSNNPAIRIDGSAGSVILNAQKGHLVFSGSAHAKQATAEKIIMSGSTVVQYESGLADPNFQSGPSGSWSISAWDEI